MCAVTSRKAPSLLVEPSKYQEAGWSTRHLVTEWCVLLASTLCCAAVCCLTFRVTVIEAKELLGTFDGSLREYAARKLVAQGVKLRRVRTGGGQGGRQCKPWPLGGVHSTHVVEG
jgi:hypothetical protein